MDMQAFIERIQSLHTLTAGEIVQLRLDLAKARCEALQELWEQRAKALVPKDPQWTELDRTTMLNGFTAEKESEYQLLLALEDIVAQYS